MHATAVHDLEGQKDTLQVIGSCISSPVLLDCLPCLKSFFVCILQFLCSADIDHMAWSLFLYFITVYNIS